MLRQNHIIFFDNTCISVYNVNIFEYDWLVFKFTNLIWITSCFSCKVTDLWVVINTPHINVTFNVDNRWVCTGTDNKYAFNIWACCIFFVLKILTSYVLRFRIICSVSIQTDLTVWVITPCPYAILKFIFTCAFAQYKWMSLSGCNADYIINSSATVCKIARSYWQYRIISCLCCFITKLIISV